MSAIRADVATLKIDVAAVKGDMATLKVDVNALKTDVTGLKVGLTRVEGELALLKWMMDLGVAFLVAITVKPFLR